MEIFWDFQFSMYMDRCLIFLQDGQNAKTRLMRMVMLLRLKYMIRIMNLFQEIAFLFLRIPMIRMVLLIEVKNMDKDRNIVNHPQSGVAITEYKYDEAGQRTETLRYDKDRVAGYPKISSEIYYI